MLRAFPGAVVLALMVLAGSDAASAGKARAAGAGTPGGRSDAGMPRSGVPGDGGWGGTAGMPPSSRVYGGWPVDGGWGGAIVVPAPVAAAPPLVCGCYDCFPLPPPSAWPAPIALPPAAGDAEPVAVEAVPVQPPRASVTAAGGDASESASGLPPAWYWCEEPAGYYPYVAQCSRPWRRMVPLAAPPDAK